MNIDNKILELIKFIVCYATEHNMRLTTVRLVKFIYLADVYHARAFEGKTLTSLPWTFVYYGPYCSEVMECIDRAIDVRFISRATFESNYGKKDYQLYECHDDDYDRLKRSFPREVISELQFMIKKYGDSTPELLDYVYYGTEPMRDVQKGDKLDFKSAATTKDNTTTTAQIGKISGKDIEKIKVCIRHLREKFEIAKDNLVRDDRETERWKDEIYYQSLDSINEEDMLPDLEGTAKIII